jgi:Tol biopolymer transport system component
MQVRTGLLAVLLPGILVGCGDSPRPLEPNVAEAATILSASPPALYAAPGSRIPAPTVVVHDRDRRALAGVPVHFTVVDGGYVTDPSVTTDAEGKASAGSWVLGNEEGVNVLLATVAGVAPPLVLVANGGLKPAHVSYGLGRIDQGRPLGLGGFYILYEDSTFARAYLSADLHGNVTTRSDAGLFTRADSSITFLENQRFSSWAGTVRGDSMFILNPSDLSLEVYAGTLPVSPYGAFPPVSGPARIYKRVTEHRHPPGALSRYVLYDDSTFALQYLGPTGEYTGRYSRTGSAVDFSFDGWSTAGPWEATGFLHGDSLVVEYNIVMWLSDFEDGVYRLEPGHPTSAPHLFVARADGSAVTRLVPGSWPAWSPDGRRIALQRNGEIYLINADGSDEARVSEGEHPAWSPDGTRIVFTSGEGIAVMASDGSAVTTVLRHDFRDDTYAPWDMGVGKPAWSPDGERIAFEHLGDGDLQPAQIYIMNADGSDPRRLTMSSDGRRYAESDPAWSPDGSRIVFWSYGYGIATVSASGGVPSSAYNQFPAVAYGARPRWSPDGSTIAFTAHTASTVAPAIWVVPAGGGSASVLVPGGQDAAWSPDGEKIVFVSTHHD